MYFWGSLKFKVLDSILAYATQSTASSVSKTRQLNN